MIKRLNEQEEDMEMYKQLEEKVMNHETIKVKFVNGEEEDKGTIKLRSDKE